MEETRWRPRRSHSIPVEAVAETIDELKAEFGVAEPEKIVERARAEDHPLHNQFTWDDTEAATRYRLIQAKRLAASVQSVYHERETVAPTFVSVTKETPAGVRRGYVRVEEALAATETREQVMREALRQLQAWKRRYAWLSELAKVVEVIDRATEKAS